MIQFRLSRNLAFFVLSFLSITGIHSTYAGIVLKQIEESDGKIRLLFNETPKKESVGMEFINDFVQLTFKNASIYPAKVLPIESQQIKKVFAYQFSSDVLRCRIFLQRPADLVKDQVKMNFRNREVSIEIDQTKPLRSKAETHLQAVSVKGEVEKESLLKAENVDDLSPEKIEESKPESLDISEANAESLEDLTASSALGQTRMTADSAPLAQAHPLPSLRSALVKLGLLVLGFIVLAAMVHFARNLIPGLGKSSKKNRPAKSGFFKSMSDYARSRMKTDEGMIEVISTHHLDPRMKIAVVRVAGRLLVLGISPDSMNLITKLSDDDSGVEEKIEEEIEEEIISQASQSLKGFSDVLSSESKKVAFHPDQPPASGIRSRIKSRLENLKPL